MNSISEFFNKFIKLKEDSEAIKNQIRVVIKEVAGLDLLPQEIDWKEGILKVNCSPLIRTQIILNQNKIINKLTSLSLVVKQIR